MKPCASAKPDDIAAILIRFGSLRLPIDVSLKSCGYSMRPAPPINRFFNALSSGLALREAETNQPIVLLLRCVYCPRGQLLQEAPVPALRVPRSGFNRSKWQTIDWLP